MVSNNIFNLVFDTTIFGLNIIIQLVTETFDNKDMMHTFKGQERRKYTAALFKLNRTIINNVKLFSLSCVSTYLQTFNRMLKVISC